MFEAFNPSTWADDEGLRKRNLERLDHNPRNDRIANLAIMTDFDKMAHVRRHFCSDAMAEAKVWKVHPDPRLAHLLFDGERGVVWKYKPDGTLVSAGGAGGRNGRWKITLRFRYRLMYEAYHADECGEDGHIGSDWDIDHIDGDCHNDRIINLQKLRRADHARKTNEQTEKTRAPMRPRLTLDNVDATAVWKTVGNGFDGYFANQFGQIRTPAGRITTGSIDKESKYAMLKCAVNSVGASRLQTRRYTTCAHRLVCMAFHGPPPTPQHTVDHIDRNKLNNTAENLRWASKSEQAENRDGGRRLELRRLDAPESEAPELFDSISRAARHLQKHVPALKSMKENTLLCRLRVAADNASEPTSAKRGRLNGGGLEGWSARWGFTAAVDNAGAGAAVGGAGAGDDDVASDDEDSKEDADASDEVKAPPPRRVLELRRLESPDEEGPQRFYTFASAARHLRKEVAELAELSTGALNERLRRAAPTKSKPPSAKRRCTEGADSGGGVVAGWSVRWVSSDAGAAPSAASV